MLIPNAPVVEHVVADVVYVGANPQYEYVETRGKYVTTGKWVKVACGVPFRKVVEE